MMSDQNNTGNSAYGPDVDSEFTFGPRSIYVEEMASKDGVSTIGFMGPDMSTMKKDEFEPLSSSGNQYKAAKEPSARRPPPPRQTNSRRGPPSNGRQAPPPPTNQMRSSQSSAQRNPSMVEPSEYFSDEPPATSPVVDDDNSSKPEHFSRVAEWHNQVEAQYYQDDEEQNNRKRLVRDSHSVATRSSVQSQRRHKRAKKMLLLMLLICACLFLFAIGLAIGITFLVISMNDDDDDDFTTKEVDLTDPPTNAPVAPTPAPTPSPVSTTMMPTPGELPLSIVQELTGSTSYGTTVAMDDNWMAVGSPSLNSGGSTTAGPTSSGLVSAMFNDGSQWQFVDDISGTPNSAFGAAIDIVKPSSTSNDAFLLVGAPDAGSNGEGHAFLYKYDSSSASPAWEMQGSILQGEPTLSMTAENFGNAVALSKSLTAVIGAPQHDFQGTAAGRVYTYQYDVQPGGSVVARNMVPNEAIIGQTANSRFGEDVAITDNGNYMAVGEPGISSFAIFNFDGNAWLKVFQHSMSTQYTDFGSSVTFLSPRYVAVGAPSFDSNRGAIQVFEIDNQDRTIWRAVPVLKGAVRGDKIGAINTVSGHEGPNGPELVIGMESGIVERWDLIGGTQWVRRYSVSRPSSVNAIAAYSTGDDYMVLAGHGTGQEAVLYAGQPQNGGQPSMSPVTGPPKEWQLAGGPFSSTNSNLGNTQFGHDVALVGDFLAIGEPLGGASEYGDVAIYERGNTEWVLDDSGFAQDTIKYGFAVDGAMIDNVPTIVVGATESYDGQLNILGSAHIYQRDLATNNWNAVGDPLGLRPQFFDNVNGDMYGTSVSIASDKLRFAIGAPNSGGNGVSGTNSGKVYIYDYDGMNWVPFGGPIVGSEPNNLVGTSVSMSTTGDKLLVGAPGHISNSGGIYFYNWNGTAWDSLVSMRGSPGERLGTTVSILDPAGTIIAFGAPTFGQDKGRVRIFYESNPGFYQQLGNEDIVGADGEAIGTTLSGAKGRVCFGTANGSFRAYELVGQNWVEISSGPNLGQPVVSISMAADGNSVAVGLSNEEVVVYDLA